jgi:hypothetical protein
MYTKYPTKRYFLGNLPKNQVIPNAWMLPSVVEVASPAPTPSMSSSDLKKLGLVGLYSSVEVPPSALAAFCKAAKWGVR